ncbi:PIN domain-containing protein [Leucobacter sp. gxy201]|uniref:type II toxin-antitoxin system VapC family toxin n=1 Tax=Leucobacter sp. gxy201 TaxID=2957200 RepID=UPI003DA07EBB
MGVIYLDSCIVIYAVEDAGERGSRVRGALAAAEDVVAVSPLVAHECLVGPYRARDLELRDHYLEFIDRLERVALDTDVFLRAAELRAHTGLRTPDALHLAAAQHAGCAELWTNDQRFAKASRGLARNILEG